MTESSLPGSFTAGDFRIGHVLSRTASIFARNALAYLAVTAVAALPPLLVSVLVPPSPVTVVNPFQSFGAGGFTIFSTIVLGILSQAIVLYGAFQDMRGRPVKLANCLKVGLRRFLPLIGLAISVGVAMLLYMVFIIVAMAGLFQVLQTALQAALLIPAFVLLIIPLLLLYLIWFVATPACVLERLGPFRSLGRSRGLTKGHRWKVFGLVLVVLIPALIVAGIITGVMAALGIGVSLRIGVFFDLNRALNTVAAQVVSLIWTAVWTAFYAILVAVAYHDLRVSKEGVDTEQIAAVFE
jgi:hypothetical protein